MTPSAAASTGFRAPGLNQSYYAHVSTGFRNDGSGNQVAYEIGEIPVESPGARAPLHDSVGRRGHPAGRLRPARRWRGGPARGAL